MDEGGDAEPGDAEGKEPRALVLPLVGEEGSSKGDDAGGHPHQAFAVGEEEEVGEVPHGSTLRTLGAGGGLRGDPLASSRLFGLRGLLGPEPSPPDSRESDLSLSRHEHPGKGERIFWRLALVGAGVAEVVEREPYLEGSLGGAKGARAVVLVGDSGGGSGHYGVAVEGHVLALVVAEGDA